MKDVIRYELSLLGLLLIVPLMPFIILAELLTRGGISKHTFGPSVTH